MNVQELISTPIFGIVLSIAAFMLGRKLQEKLHSVLCNPLLVATVILVVLLLVLDIPYETYYEGGSMIHLLLTPATVCLAVSIYSKISVLKENSIPILVGCAAGSLSSMGCVYVLCRLFGLDGAMTASLLPKSVTTPIAVEVCESLGGIPSVTVIAVIFTGIAGSVLAPFLIRMFRVQDPMAAGLAIGACSHALGTSKALEIGETEGAMSGLAIGICGIITVIVSSILL